MQNTYLIYPERHVIMCDPHPNRVFFSVCSFFPLSFSHSPSLLLFVVPPFIFCGEKNVWWWRTNIKIWFSLWYCLLNVCDAFARIIPARSLSRCLSGTPRKSLDYSKKKNMYVYKWKSFKANFYVELTIFTCAQSTYHQRYSFPR